MKDTDKYNNLVQSIKDDEEKEKEQNRFDATLEQTKEAHSLARKTLDATREANEANAKTLKVSMLPPKAQRTPLLAFAVPSSRHSRHQSKRGLMTRV